MGITDPKSDSNSMPVAPVKIGDIKYTDMQNRKNYSDKIPKNFESEPAMSSTTNPYNYKSGSGKQYQGWVGEPYKNTKATKKDEESKSKEDKKKEKKSGEKDDKEEKKEEKKSKRTI